MLKEVPEIITPVEKEYTRHSYHLYPVLIDIDKTGVTRDDFIKRLKENNIGTSVHFIPLHLHPYYQNKYRYKKGDFHVAEYLFDREVSLPMYPGMTKDDVMYVVETIKNIFKK